ncbi:MAG: helix-turn-helix domain-containing protein [Chloroflexota bacterium]
MYALDERMVDYLELVHQFPLLSLRDDAHLDAAIGELHRLLAIPERSPGEDAYLGALGDLIEVYETARVVLPQASGLEVLAHLMEANDLKQKDMDFAFGNKAVTSAVMSGARPLGLTHARRLSERFHLPIDVFLATR